MSLASRLRAWAHRSTRAKRYSPVGQAFHWSMAALVLFQLWWGWRLGRLPVGGDKLEGYQVHSQLGVLILVLILLRAVWRLMVPGPVNDADKPGWQSKAAHLTHYAFYGLLIGIPVTGWMMWSSMASEQPLSLVGVAPWPQLPLQDLPRPMRWAVMQTAETLHFGFVIALVALIVLHVGAGLKHHFLDRDDVLAAMVPWLEPLPKREAQAQRNRPTQPSSPAPSDAG